MAEINSNKQFKDLLDTLKILEQKIFLHAKLNQVETIESFLSVIIRKACLENIITLIADWNNETINNKYLYIIISPQNEIPNIPIAEELFNFLINKKFIYIKFLKFVENISDKQNEDKNISMTISNGPSTPSSVLSSDKLKFSVSKFGADKYGRTIRMVVFVDEIIDKLLVQTDNDYWIPNNNLFYMLDLLLGEYYMTKHIATINFFPIMIVPPKTDFMNVNQVRETINDLLNIELKTCSLCEIPEYRAQLRTINNHNICHNCTE